MAQEKKDLLIVVVHGNNPGVSDKCGGIGSIQIHALNFAICCNQYKGLAARE